MKNTVVIFLLTATLMGCWQRDLGRSYYPSGVIKTEATVRNGLLDGPATMYYESGAKMSEASYRAGLLEGKSYAYYSNGHKKSLAEYSSGLLNGTSINWSEDGKILQEVKFKDGKLVLN